MESRVRSSNRDAACRVGLLALAVAMALRTGAVGAQDGAEPGDDVASLTDIVVTDDPLRVLPNETSGSSFGFAKPLLSSWPSLGI